MHFCGGRHQSHFSQVRPDDRHFTFTINTELLFPAHEKLKSNMLEILREYKSKAWGMLHVLFAAQLNKLWVIQGGEFNLSETVAVRFQLRPAVMLPQQMSRCFVCTLKQICTYNVH